MWEIVHANKKHIENCNIYGLSYKQIDKEYIEKHKKKDGPADFETAIEATHFGYFNILLLFASLPCSWASGFDSSSISYILPAAECDLNLTPFKKGMLNAITYCGMITSAFLWGFLTDSYGRRKLLIIGYLLSGIFDFMCTFSFNFYYLLAIKYLNGCSICGPFAAFMTYLSEAHGLKYRAQVILLTGIWFSLGNITIPFLAWQIIPLNIEIVIMEGFLVLHSWNIFLAIACLPGLIAGTSMYFFPESPKFLMSKGRNEEAMKVFQTIYSINTGLPRETFPIKELVQEVQNKPISIISDFDGKSVCSNNVNTKSAFEIFVNDLKQTRFLFKRPYVLRISLIFLIQCFAMMGTNTLRLWLPQLFTIVENYVPSSNDTSVTICNIIENSNLGSSSNSTLFAAENCDPDNITNPDAYLKSIIVGVVQGVMYFGAGGMVKFAGKRNLLILSFITAGSLGISIYWTKNILGLLACASIFISLSSVGISTMVQVAMDLVPTYLRTMAVSLTMMFGRSGSLFGNLIFPLLLAQGCLPPFVFVGLGTLMCGFLCFLIPKTDRDPLQ